MYSIKEEKHKQQTPEVQSEHQSMANDMGNRITEYEPNQQNEMLRIIRQIVAERRQLEIERAEKNLVYLKETFQTL